MIRQENTHDWSCFTDACSDAGLPTDGIPEPTPGEFIFEYCRKHNLTLINEKCQIILEQRPAIALLRSLNEITTIHAVFLPSLRDDWQFITHREVKGIIYCDTFCHPT